MKPSDAKLSSFRRWMVVLVVAVLAAWFVVSTNIKNSIAYSLWRDTRFMVGSLTENLPPEYVASKIGSHSKVESLLRIDWQHDQAMIDAIDMKWSKATPNKDAWGSLFYFVCDFNNDGHIPNPETLTAPSKSGAAATLKRRLAIFSAGPDGDPATWADNVPPSFE